MSLCFAHGATVLGLLRQEWDAAGCELATATASWVGLLGDVTGLLEAAEATAADQDSLSFLVRLAPIECRLTVADVLPLPRKEFTPPPLAPACWGVGAAEEAIAALTLPRRRDGSQGRTKSKYRRKSKPPPTADAMTDAVADAMTDAAKLDHYGKRLADQVAREALPRAPAAHSVGSGHQRSAVQRAEGPVGRLMATARPPSAYVAEVVAAASGPPARERWRR